MVLAAGRGERLRPLTDEIPKSLVEVRGQSLLERHLEHIRSAGIETVVINLGWLGEEIVKRVGSGARYGLEVIYSQATTSSKRVVGFTRHYPRWVPSRFWSSTPISTPTCRCRRWISQPRR